MIRNKTDLYMGCHAACMVFADKAVNEGGGYKTIAEVTYEGGNIRWKADIRKYPRWVRELVEDFAKKNKETFLAQFEEDVKNERMAWQLLELMMSRLPSGDVKKASDAFLTMQTMEEQCRYVLPLFLASN